MVRLLKLQSTNGELPKFNRRDTELTVVADLFLQIVQSKQAASSCCRKQDNFY